MAEMKNICGKIPMDLHEKVREGINANIRMYRNDHLKMYKITL